MREPDGSWRGQQTHDIAERGVEPALEEPAERDEAEGEIWRGDAVVRHMGERAPTSRRQRGSS